MTFRDFASRVTSIAALAEPVRRALYLYVVRQPEPVSREQAAAAVGVARHVAKFNLDKLEECKLLDVEFARPAGRRGPGAGRTAKLYKQAVGEVEVSLPERQYDLVGRIMAEAITESEQNCVPIADALRGAATQAGRDLAAEVNRSAGTPPSPDGALDAVREVLAENGYQPRHADDGLSLANCPFHTLAQAHNSLICGINRDLIDSLVQASAPGEAKAELKPTPGMCCVRITGAAIGT